MGCCISKKKRKENENAGDSGLIPLNVQKDKEKFPEETESTQHSEHADKLKVAQKTERSTTTKTTEPGIRSLRKETAKILKEKLGLHGDKRQVIPQPTPTVIPAESSQKNTASKDAKIFPENTNSTQNSETENIHKRTEKSAKLKEVPVHCKEINKEDMKSNSNEDRAKTVASSEMKEQQSRRSGITEKDSISVSDYKTWSKEMRQQFPELTENTQSGEDQDA